METVSTTLAEPFDATKERIKNLFEGIDVSVSPYDTAWLAMVPSPNSPEISFFPQCLQWVLDNQLDDGSWSMSYHPRLIKDTLLSTLTCVLALKHWCTGEEAIQKGLQFIQSYFSLANEGKSHTPIGFSILFTGLLEYASDMNLKIQLNSTVVDILHHRRDAEIRRVQEVNTVEGKAYLAYISEATCKLNDWKMIMQFKRKNGSLFNSPATTAAAYIYVQDPDCLRYLCLLVQQFKNAVPTIYPLDLYASLCMVDDLQKLGIDRYFAEEIRHAMDETYRLWLHGDDNVFEDCATYAMAFRMLRNSGYNISLGQLTRFSDLFLCSPRGFLKDASIVLEIYRASEVTLPNEPLLEEENLWARHFLEEQLKNHSIFSDRIEEHIVNEVRNALDFPYYANLDRLSTRRHIDNYRDESTRILKSSYRCMQMGNADILDLAIADYNFCQKIQREELKQLETWVVENQLDKLNFARQKLGYCYFSCAATLFAPELADARLAWAKNGVLTTIVDDFFDVGGLEEEMKNLVELVERWDTCNPSFCSKKVEIIYRAIRSTVSEISEKAFSRHGRAVTNHISNIWLNLLRSMLKEATWTREKATPALEEYMENGYVSFALGPIVLPTLYLVGPTLAEEVMESPEMHELFKTMSMCGRLLNDWRGFEREAKEGKINAVSLHMIHQKCGPSKEEAVDRVRFQIEDLTKHLLATVLRTKGSVVPRLCKDLFWKMLKVLRFFYMRNDGFTSDDISGTARAMIGIPISRKCSR